MPERSATRSGTAFKRWSAAAASVQAFLRDVMVGDRAAEQAKPSRAVSRERPAMRTGPQGAKRPEPQGDQRERDRRPAATAPSVSDCRGLAAVEASPAPCRAQRRAGADLGGRDWRERSAAQWTPDATAGSMPAAFRAAFLPRTPSARPDRYLVDGATFTPGARQRGRASAGPCARSEIAEERADGVTDRSNAESWRDVCRWFRVRSFTAL